jgi:hypothetical protein
MMWHEVWSSLRSTDVANIFYLSFGVLLAKVLVRYLTKLPIIAAEQRDEDAVKAAHFDCLRVGIDLTFLGLVAGFGVLRVVLKHAQQPRLDQIASFQGPFLMIQFIFILLAVIFTTVYRSPEKFKKGTFVPSMMGIFSVITTILFYIVWSK